MKKEDWHSVQDEFPDTSHPLQDENSEYVNCLVCLDDGCFHISRYERIITTNAIPVDNADGKVTIEKVTMKSDWFWSIESGNSMRPNPWYVKYWIQLVSPY